MKKNIWCLGLLSLAMLACTDGEITEPSENPDTPLAEISSSSNGPFVDLSSSSSAEEGYSNQSSSFSGEYSSSSSTRALSSSAMASALCKVSGDWGSQGCVITYPHGEGDLWSTGKLKVKTNVYAEDSSKFGDRAGEFFFETDSSEGGNTQIYWTNMAELRIIPEFMGGLEAEIEFDKENLASDLYFNIGFYVAGFDSNGVALSADISNWNGLCILFAGTIGPILQLDLGDSLNQELNNILPSVIMSRTGKPQCYEWKDFVQPETDKEHKVISGDEAARHVEKIIFHFQEQPGVEHGDYEPEAIEFIAIGTNRDE